MNTVFLSHDNPDGHPNEPPTNLSLQQATDIIIERSKLLVSQAINKRGHDKPPFLADEYAGLLRITRILKADIGELGGMLLRYGDGSFIIKVNGTHLPVRQNFSSAHEIGHILLSELKLESCLADSEFRTRTFNPQMVHRGRNKARERLCDVAASEVLMPEDVFKKYLSQVSIGSLERLAKIFNTSIQTTAIRIAEISPIPCIALLWKPQKTKTSKVLRLIWHIGPGRKSSDRNQYLPLNDTVTNSSTVYEAYQENKVVKSYKQFKNNSGTQRLLMESKGYGYDTARYVISLAFPST